MRNAKLGVSSSERSLMPVTGQVLFPLSSQRWMHDRSYVWPVTTITGSTMSSMDTGHEKCAGTGIFGLPPPGEGMVAIAPRKRRGEQTTKRPGVLFSQPRPAGARESFTPTAQKLSRSDERFRVRPYPRPRAVRCLPVRPRVWSGEVNLPRRRQCFSGSISADR